MERKNNPCRTPCQTRCSLRCVVHKTGDGEYDDEHLAPVNFNPPGGDAWGLL